MSQEKEQISLGHHHHAIMTPPALNTHCRYSNIYYNMRNVYSRLFPKVYAASVGGEMGSEIHMSPGQSMFDPPPGETGWERVNSIFESNIYGELSPEIMMIRNNTYMGILCGGMLGAFVHSRTFAEDYVRKNKEMLYMNVTDAKRRFQDNFILAMMRGGFQWGWRVGLFCGAYSSVTIVLATYHNDVSVWHHMLAGGICGGVWKHRQGLRAMGVATLLGTTLGALAGCVVKGTMWLTGVSLPELRYWHYTYYHNKIQRKAEAKRNKKVEEGMELLDHHQKQLEKKEKSDVTDAAAGS